MMAQALIGQDIARFVLASTSPRRLELLYGLGFEFDVIASHIDERIDPSLTPEDLVKRLAYDKASEVAQKILAGKSGMPSVSVRQDSDKKTISFPNSQARFILGADTVVVLDGQILGKPGSKMEACQMLTRLSGRCHQVFTGVALVEIPSQVQELDFAVSNVYFRSLGKEEIEFYVAGGEPMDKAGAYALQGSGSALVERIEGCYTNIIGLPIPIVVKLLRRFGVVVLGVP